MFRHFVIVYRSLHSCVKPMRNLFNKAKLLDFAGPFNQWTIYSIY